MSAVIERPVATSVRLVSLKRDDPESWALMPAVLERVVGFCQRYQSEANAMLLCNWLMANFAAPETTDPQTGRVLSPMLLMMAAVHDGRVVGHLIASVDLCYGAFVGTVIQYEYDEPIPRRLLAAGFEYVEHWCSRRGATRLQVLARVDERGHARVRAFNRFFGLKESRVVMAKEING